MCHKKTIIACYIGYIVQAISNNFAPLLFLILQAQYQIPLTRITMLISVITFEKKARKDGSSVLK